METRTAIFTFVISLIIAFFVYVFIQNRKMIENGQHDYLNKNYVKEQWSLKKRRTTTIKKAAK